MDLYGVCSLMLTCSLGNRIYNSYIPQVLIFSLIFIARKVHECYSIQISSSPTSTNKICIMKLVLHKKFYDEGSTKIAFITISPLIVVMVTGSPNLLNS